LLCSARRRNIELSVQALASGVRQIGSFIVLKQVLSSTQIPL